LDASFSVQSHVQSQAASQVGLLLVGRASQAFSSSALNSSRS
jgi:hypothetical protein